MSDKFKVGDIVELKGGSPKMTVIEIGTMYALESQLKCSWFAGRKNEHAWFPPDALIHASNESETK